MKIIKKFKKRRFIFYTLSAIYVFGSVFLFRATEAQAAGSGWSLEQNNWKYLNEDRVPVKGWVLVGEEWYYMDPNTGVMKTGWIQSPDGKWFFLNNASDGSNGKMLTGWQWIDGNCYFFASEGKDQGGMQTGGKTPDGFQIDGQGRWVNEQGIVQFEQNKGILTNKEKAADGREKAVGSVGSGSTDRIGSNKIGSGRISSGRTSSGNVRHSKARKNKGSEEPKRKESVKDIQDKKNNLEEPGEKRSDNPGESEKGDKTEKEQISTPGNAEKAPEDITNEIDDPKEVDDKPEADLEEAPEVNAITISSWEPVEKMHVAFGEGRRAVIGRLPSKVTVTLSSGNKVEVEVTEWTGEINTYRQGAYTVKANYELPDGVSGEKPEITAMIEVAPKPAKMEVKLDKKDYDYSEDPILTIANYSGGDSVAVIWNKDVKDVTLTAEKEYRYDEASHTVTLITNQILKRDSGILSSPVSLDITIKVGEQQFLKTILYRAGKNVWANPKEYKNLERKKEARVSLVGLEEEDYVQLQIYVQDKLIQGTKVVKESDNGIENIYAVIPYEPLKDILDKDGAVTLTGRLPKAKDFSFTLSYVQEAVPTKLKELDAEVKINDMNGTVDGYPIYAYSESETIKINIKNKALTKAFLEKNLKVEIQSGDHARFTAPTMEEKKVGVFETGHWSISRQVAGNQLRVPTDQTRGHVEYKRKKDGSVPVTNIFLNLDGYEEKVLKVVVLP